MFNYQIEGNWSWILFIKLYLRLSFFNRRLFPCSEALWHTILSITFVSWWCWCIKCCAKLAKSCRYHTKLLWYGWDSGVWHIDWPQNFKSQTHNPKIGCFEVFYKKKRHNITKIGQNATKKKILVCLMDDVILKKKWMLHEKEVQNQLAATHGMLYTWFDLTSPSRTKSYGPNLLPYRLTANLREGKVAY